MVSLNTWEHWRTMKYFSCLQSRDQLKIKLKIKPKLTGPESIAHSLAAVGRREEGLGGVDATLLQLWGHPSVAREVGCSENPGMVWKGTCSVISQMTLSGLG